MRIVPIPILRDNYAYLIIDEAAGVAGVVDPAEPEPVCAALAREGVRLTHVLCTHHHWDHSGGNVAMAKRFSGVQVVGSADDAKRIPALTTPVGPDDEVTIGTLRGRVLPVPCHTRGHIAFRFGDALFCGDTLFVAGCGRFFEGDAAQMDHALNTVIAGLPDETRLFCGHEYTLSNLRFALTIEPGNPALKKRQAWAEARRAADLPTVPSTVGDEKQTNPFLRVRTSAVAAAVGETDPIAVMAALRARKDDFTG
ncbi:MAG: hydroxyacylglutathione hydrolase [Myxococcales bacterium]|nr:hydroxyacylglutathione hydrolase [Myxococcales bacterium]